MFADEIAAALPGLRVAAESRMLSRATVRRKTSRTAQDEDTGREVPVWDVIAIDLPTRLVGDRGASRSRTVSTPGGDVEVAAREAHVPHDTAGIKDGDWLDITYGERAGTAWRIVEADAADQQTALRLPVVAEARPEEWV